MANLPAPILIMHGKSGKVRLVDQHLAVGGMKYEAKVLTTRWIHVCAEPSFDRGLRTFPAHARWVCKDHFVVHAFNDL